MEQSGFQFVVTNELMNAERRLTMRKLDFKNIEFLWGIGLSVIGFSLFVAIDGPLRYLGIVFVIVAILFFVRIFTSTSSNTDNENFKSRTRDQIYKYQHKR